VTYSIIGSGHIGSAIVRHFARKDINVAIANNHGPDSLAPLRKELGQGVAPQASALTEGARPQKRSKHSQAWERRMSRPVLTSPGT
jgi:predicted dinucleotide-binding enzyme